MGVKSQTMALLERPGQPAGVGDDAGPFLDRQQFVLHSDRHADFAKVEVDPLGVADVENLVHQRELPQRGTHWRLKTNLQPPAACSMHRNNVKERY